ncbi:hypothetical protein MYSTI_00926 [Myxococcus stipitatus DSM 14675]|uniref:Uncharacterized protein n=1 Tax=Myxococcus stipitatus (strain DSM 14675 / JCM 12634 / Mx s8) TaxID=1278073 RepID=L7U348_MYXSD|nr:hypothetical protein [Myxococcus stipitatus]AGC42275.1 hypothetical protein MYSTI_00926 [Myxococcus stipitatus DSM 14675]
MAAPPRSHPLSREALVPAVHAVVEELLAGRFVAVTPQEGERLSRCLLHEPTPATFEELLARLYAAPEYGRDVFGDATSAFALVRLAIHLYGAPSRLATVPGDLVISHDLAGAVPTPFWVPGNLKVDGILKVDEGAWLLCTGDVEVGGATLDYELGSVIAVGGSLTTARMCTMGAVTIGGRLEVSDTLLAWRNDHRLVVEGGLRAGLLVAWDHTLHAEVSAGVRLDTDATPEVLHAHLRADILTGEGRAVTLDVEAADGLLRRDESLRG